MKIMKIFCSWVCRFIFPQPRHMGEGLGLIPKHMTDSEDSCMEDLTLLGEQK
ncbi:hypothetical protein I79_023399 [Cricetulus griseus]|uniref:Uncharacterized protein n=1 Tax=Cricetulus griseus TaxID=10029 RepID=G3IHU3_CRIGR|nr:hypothetical protein I79_023399 [Cricetulus griseus]